MATILRKASILFILVFFFINLSGQNRIIRGIDTTYLDNDSIFLSVEEYRGQIQWQSSLDSLNWFDITGSESDTLFIFLDSSAVYRAKIIENSCDPVYSDTIFVFEERKSLLSDDVILVPEEQWKSSIDTTDSDSVEIVFNYSFNDLDTIQPGHYIFSDANDGYIFKVIDTNKDTTGNKVSIRTAPTSITEIFSDLYVDHSEILKNDPKEAYSLNKGVQLSPYGNKGLELLHFDLNAVLYDLDGNLETDYDQIRITGEYKLEPKINSEILIQKKELKRIAFEYEFKNTFDFKITIANGISTDDRLVKELFKKPKKLARIYIPTPIGVPLVFVPELQIEVGAELGIESEISAGIQHYSTTKATMVYQSGKWRTEKVTSKETNPILPSLEETKAYAKVFIKPEIAIKLYSFIGPYADLEVYGELDIAPFFDPWWQFYGGAKMGIGFKLEAFAISGFDFSVDIFDYKYIIAHAPTSANIKPSAAISVEPSSGIPGTVFSFNALECSDLEDETSDLEVRWDWNNDGIWDTQFSKIKTSSYTYTETGTYVIKLQVKDTEGATNEISTIVTVAEVENKIPVALFSYNPENPEPDEQIMFSASASYDSDGSDNELVFAWDWENDGTLDTDFNTYKYAFHSYSDKGRYNARLVVKDIGGKVGTIARDIQVGHTGEYIEGLVALLVVNKNSLNGYDNGFINVLNTLITEYTVIDINDITTGTINLSDFCVVVSNIMGYDNTAFTYFSSIKQHILSSLSGGTEYIVGSESGALLSALELAKGYLNPSWYPALNDTRVLTTRIINDDITAGADLLPNYQSYLGQNGQLLSSYFGDGVFWKVMSNYYGNFYRVLGPVNYYPTHRFLGIASGWKVSAYEYGTFPREYVHNNSRIMEFGRLWTINNDTKNQGWIGPEGIQVLSNTLNSYINTDYQMDNPGSIGSCSYEIVDGNTTINWSRAENADYYEIWQTNDGENWGLIGLIPQTAEAQYSWTSPLTDSRTYKIRTVLDDTPGSFADINSE